MKKTRPSWKKKSQIVNTFKFMYPNWKPFRDGKTGSRPTAAAASYIIMVYRYITRIYASRQIAIFFPDDDDTLLFCQFSKQFVQLYCYVVTRGSIIIIVIHYNILRPLLWKRSGILATLPPQHDRNWHRFRFARKSYFWAGIAISGSISAFTIVPLMNGFLLS